MWGWMRAVLCGISIDSRAGRVRVCDWVLAAIYCRYNVTSWTTEYMCDGVL